MQALVGGFTVQARGGRSHRRSKFAITLGLTMDGFKRGVINRRTVYGLMTRTTVHFFFPFIARFRLLIDGD